MEKVWLKQYEAGVPAEIDPDNFSSINELFDSVCEQFKEKPAFTNMDQTLSFEELKKKSRDFAAYLQTIFGLKKGDRVTIMLPNLLQYPVALFGILRAGLIVVNINPLYTPRELERQLNDSESETIIILANFAATLQQVVGKVPIKNIIVTEVGDMLSFPKSWIVNWVVKNVKKMVPPWFFEKYSTFKDVLRVGETKTFVRPEIWGHDIAFLQYTGGTTGKPKGAMLTHRNMIANIEQAHAWIKPEIKVGEEIIITALPLYHIFSLMANGLTFLRIGALNVLVTNPRDMNGFIKILSKYKFTAITGVNTLFNALLNRPKFASLDFSALRISLGGGMAVQRAVAERWKAITGCALLEAYGLTETSPAACINPLNLKEYNGSVGLPISSTAVSIRDEAGKELGFNEHGELWIKGPQVAEGYWQQPEETKLTFLDGWVKTGDIATIDEAGFVRIVDRKKDMILVSGFNVYPNEVEDVIASMKEVAQVAVVGVVDAQGEEHVKAFIVKRDPNLTAEDVIKYCHTQLTGYKVPKQVEFRKELPLSNVGKILRRELRDNQ